jgi:hypothetical protein
LDDYAIYLVPLGRGRFDLYAEPPAGPEPEPDSEAQARAGFWQRQAHRFHQGWRETSRAAYAARGADRGVLARMRDWLVRRIADSIAEQQTLWSLRGRTEAAFVYPDDLSETAAADVRDRLLAAGRRRHGFWLAINLLVAALTLALVLLPGPNLIGYYFAFRVIGHFLSWRGTRQALSRMSWRPRAEPRLTDLARLAALPSDARSVQVSEIAARLGLARLQSFFDRATTAGSD